MDLKKLDAAHDSGVVGSCRLLNRAGWASLFAMTLLAACSGPPELDNVGLPDRSTTACEYVGGDANVMGPAESAFACRGKVVISGGALVGIAKAGKDQAYELFNAADDGAIKRVGTEHRGNVRLSTTSAGVLAVSTAGSDVVWSAHKTDLSPLKAGKVTAKGGEILDFAVVAAGPELQSCEPGSETAEGTPAPEPARPSASEPMLVVVLSAKGVEVVALTPAGEEVANYSALAFPEMPYCSEIRASSTGGTLELAVACLEVLPKAVAADEAGVPTVSEFEYEEEVPPATEIVVTSTCLGGRLTASIGPPAEKAPDAAYALKNYLKDQLPRPAGHRANMLDAVDLGNQRVFALACVGPDAGPVELHASVLTCPEHP
jgi:hypothetical protein